MPRTAKHGSKPICGKKIPIASKAQSYQGNIPLPAEFDIFLGFLFSRIGSRLTEEEYRRDIMAKRANFHAAWTEDENVGADLMALTQLTADRPADSLPTGTTFEIINARDAAQRPGADGRPCLWLVVNGAMDQTTALSHMAQLGYDEATAQLALQAHTFSHLHAHRLGLGVLKKMLHDNVIDVLEFGAHLSAQGYSQEDINLLQLEFLQPTAGKVRQLSLAEIKAGFKAGALLETQAAQHLKTLGYSDADIAVILKTLPQPKPPTPPATPAAG